MAQRQSLTAYRDALSARNTARYGGEGGNSYAAPSVTRTSTAASAFSSPSSGSRAGDMAAARVAAVLANGGTMTEAHRAATGSAPSGGRLADGQGNSLNTPQNAYAQALAGGGVLENPFAQSYGYLQSLMNGTAYDADSLRYTEPTGGYADIVQENANKIVSPVYNPVNAAQWNYDVPETVRMQSGGQLSPAAEAYSGMAAAANTGADLAMAKYWADIAANTTSESDRQYALRRAMNYRNRLG